MGIIINGLTKKYDQQFALNKVTFSINEGEVVGLLGPNGAGKSTLMKSITNAIDFDEGDIVVNNYSVTTEAIKAKEVIGFLQENNPLYMDMYVKEYLHFVAEVRKVSKNRVDDVLLKVGLEAEQHKKIQQLSKGYKQRVGIAQAILFDPEILILDEPTNGLDPNQIIEIRELIREIGKEKTVILSTHIMQEVEALCSRVILLNNGRVIADQSIEDFKGQYQNLEEAFHALTN